ncbi:MAG: hypothetical protein PVH91_06265 [Pseudomonadales bacterium]|jgi:hypothetical protein
MTRIRRTGALLALVLLAASAFAADYSDHWGPAVGSKLPVLEAPDQTGTVRTLDDLAGDHGLLLFLNRSADW